MQWRRARELTFENIKRLTEDCMELPRLVLVMKLECSWSSTQLQFFTFTTGGNLGWTLLNFLKKIVNQVLSRRDYSQGRTVADRFSMFGQSVIVQMSVSNPAIEQLSNQTSHSCLLHCIAGRRRVPCGARPRLPWRRWRTVPQLSWAQACALPALRRRITDWNILTWEFCNINNFLRNVAGDLGSLSAALLTLIGKSSHWQCYNLAPTKPWIYRAQLT